MPIRLFSSEDIEPANDAAGDYLYGPILDF